MSERTQLHLVDGTTGESSPSPLSGLTNEQLTALLVERDRAINGYQLKVGRLEKRLAHLEAVDPAAESVQSVGAYWSGRVMEEGWWSRTPAFRPGHPRWSAVAARLAEPEYDEDYCFQVVEGSLWQDKGRIKREWVDAASIFKAGNIDKHFERAQDPYCQRVRQAQKLPEAFVELLRRPSMQFLAEACECGHPRMSHTKADARWQGRQPCLHAGCECVDFDDLMTRVEAKKDELRRRAA